MPKLFRAIRALELKKKMRAIMTFGVQYLLAYIFHNAGIEIWHNFQRPFNRPLNLWEPSPTFEDNWPEGSLLFVISESILTCLYI